jgi:hypothetical protein
MKNYNNCGIEKTEYTFAELPRFMRRALPETCKEWKFLHCPSCKSYTALEEDEDGNVIVHGT